ncbi:hypothetical protein [Brevibacillus marinus]|uniref:hypothetical protein n=1 Tax=Brevibacillus marinus TaxID=2496837 RepID=UPI000F833603|nr:hypothetical protein [Brevibacillus marinus]
MAATLIRQQALRLVGRPVGITKRDGTGVSGVLCRVGNNNLFVLVFLVGDVFPLIRIPINQIRAIRRFPACPRTNAANTAG